MIIVLNGERPFSWNRYWAGLHWAKRSKEAERVRLLVLAAIPPDCVIFDHPVRLIFTVYFKGKMQDASNICIKPYEDALIGFLIADDAPEHVASVTAIPRKDNKNPRMEIEILPCGEPLSFDAAAAYLSEKNRELWERLANE